MSEEQRTVFLLGAGFARAISPTMPLLQGLAGRVLARIDCGSHIPEEVRAMMSENFAHALSYLEQAKPWVTEADNLRHRALFLEISIAIAHDLENDAAEASKTLFTNRPSWLDRLLRHWHEQQHTVITLNYDTLIEMVAATVELPRQQRILARHLYPPVLTDAAHRSGGGGQEPPLETFRLLKVHGSTNWYYSGRVSAFGEPIYFVSPKVGSSENEGERHEQLLRAVADKYPFMVPPIYDKSPLLTHETIRALWFDAGEALKSATRIICMGYSLPESDLTMRHFLRTTCRPNATIHVVNESADAAENLRGLFRNTDVVIEQPASGPSCIPTFIDQTLTTL